MPSENALWNTLSGGNALTPAAPRFASPWSDVASQYAPRTFLDALRLCEHLYLNNGTYRSASEKIVNYFVTKPKLTGQSDEEIEKFDKVFGGDFSALERLTEIGYDFQCYGNSFASVIPPFTRVLKCQRCAGGNRGDYDALRDRGQPGSSTSGFSDAYADFNNLKQARTPTVTRRGNVGGGALAIDQVEFEFNVADQSFKARCPFCRTVTTHRAHNYPKADARRIRLQRWDPKRITIDCNPITGECEYYLEIDPYVASRVRKGDPFLLSTLPWPIVEAIAQGRKFKFNPDAIFHLKQPALAGVQLYGWGLPSILSSFRNFFRLQILHRYDEVLMMDYIVPIRIVSPANGNLGAGDNTVMATGGMNTFRRYMESVVTNHRRDGADWNFSPFPVECQNLSGDARSLSPKELIEAEQNDLLNARGIPAELYRGTLTVQVAPVGLRLFERGHIPFVAGLNRAIQWMATAVSRITQTGDVEATLESVTIVDDIQNQQARAQLMQAQLISKETGLAPLGLDAKVENDKLREELKQQQRDQRIDQQELEMEQMNLDTPEGDAEGQGGGAGGASPMDVQAQGTQLAQQLVGADENTRRQQLDAIRDQNPTLHAVVTKEMEKLRGQAGLLGRNAGLQAMSGGGAQGGGGGGQPAGQ